MSIVPVAHTQPGKSNRRCCCCALNQTHPNCGGSCSNSTEVSWINAALRRHGALRQLRSPRHQRRRHDICKRGIDLLRTFAGYDTSGGSGLSPSIWAHAREGPASVAGKTVGHWATQRRNVKFDNPHADGRRDPRNGSRDGRTPRSLRYRWSNEGLGIFAHGGRGVGGQVSEPGGATSVNLDALSRQYLGWSQPRYLADNTLASFPSSAWPHCTGHADEAGHQHQRILVGGEPAAHWWDAGMYRWLSPLDRRSVDSACGPQLMGSKGLNNFNAYHTGPHQGHGHEWPLKIHQDCRHADGRPPNVAALSGNAHCSGFQPTAY